MEKENKKNIFKKVLFITSAVMIFVLILLFILGEKIPGWITTTAYIVAGVCLVASIVYSAISLIKNKNYKEE